MNKKNAAILGGLFAVVVIVIVVILVGRNVQQKNEQANYQQMVNEVIKSHDKTRREVDKVKNDDWNPDEMRFIIFKNNSNNPKASKYFVQALPKDTDPDTNGANGMRFYERVPDGGIDWWTLTVTRHDDNNEHKADEVAKAIYDGLKDGQTEIVYDSAKDQ